MYLSVPHTLGPPLSVSTRDLLMLRPLGGVTPLSPPRLGISEETEAQGAEAASVGPRRRSGSKAGVRTSERAVSARDGAPERALSFGLAPGRALCEAVFFFFEKKANICHVCLFIYLC